MPAQLKNASAFVPLGWNGGSRRLHGGKFLNAAFSTLLSVVQLLVRSPSTGCLTFFLWNKGGSARLTRNIQGRVCAVSRGSNWGGGPADPCGKSSAKMKHFHPICPKTAMDNLKKAIKTTVLVKIFKKFKKMVSMKIFICFSCHVFSLPPPQMS